MKVLDAVVAPLVVLLLLAIAYAYVLGCSGSKFTLNLVRWVVLFLVFSALARMCVPH